MCEEFNGWTNRETWATMLWIDNDQGLYYHAKDMSAGYEDDVRGLAVALEEWIEELLDVEFIISCPPEQRKELKLMSSDIGSLYRVNWREIAEAVIDHAKEEAMV